MQGEETRPARGEGEAEESTVWGRRLHEFLPQESVAALEAFERQLLVETEAAEAGAGARVTSQGGASSSHAAPGKASSSKSSKSYSKYEESQFPWKKKHACASSSLGTEVRSTSGTNRDKEGPMSGKCPRMSASMIYSKGLTF